MRAFLSIATTVLLALLSSPVPAADPTTLQRVADEFIAPAYAEFADAAKAQHEAWQSFCAAPSSQNLEPVLAAYQRAADRWSDIEFVSYGAASKDFRAERINYWPERKNATQKALSALLGGSGEEGLDPESLRAGSAAGQGLPALERLLYEGAFADGDFSNARRCATGRSIALNVATLAAEIAQSWNDRTFSDEIENGLAIRYLATDLVTGLAVIRERKLEPMLGRGTSAANPEAAEGWRSGRSARAIELNLAGIRRMGEMLLQTSDGNVATSLASLGSARNIAKNLPADIGALAEDADGRNSLVRLLDTVALAQRRMKDDLQATLGIVIGFNSLDGD